MDFTEWFKLSIICILGAMSPGPSLAVILKHSINGGRKQGVLCGIGHGLGMTFYALVAVFGLFTFFKTIPLLFQIIQIIGAVFLIWIGIKMIISCLRKKDKIKEEKINIINYNNSFIEGFLIAFLNPKIAAWTFALFSQFIRPDSRIYEQIILISTVGGIDSIWYCFVALLTTSKGIIKKINDNAVKIDFLMGVLLVALAFGMILEIKI